MLFFQGTPDNSYRIAAQVVSIDFTNLSDSKRESSLLGIPRREYCLQTMEKVNSWYVREYST